jgi:probable HAF family extracellular repeat protein
VVGTSTTASGAEHPFLYAGGVMTDLVGDRPNYDYSEATGINDAGQVVGSAVVSQGLRHAFRYTDGVLTDLGVPSFYPVSAAKAINAAGQVAGVVFHVSLGSTAFLYVDGQWTLLSDLTLGATGLDGPVISFVATFTDGMSGVYVGRPPGR